LALANTGDTKKRDGFKKGEFFLNRRVSTFLVCLIIAGTAWSLHQLSKQYNIVVKVPAVYENLPEDRVILSELPDTLETEVRGSGFTILAYRWLNALGALKIDASKAKSLGKGDYAITANAIPTRISGTIGNGLKVVRVFPDPIIISYEGRSEKRVPLTSRISVVMSNLYRLSDSIVLNPDYVIISGPQNILDTITTVYTEVKTFTGLEKSTTQDVKVVLPLGGLVSVKPNTIKATIPVGRFTEGFVMVPVTAINMPANAVLRTYPDRIKILYEVPVEEYASVKEDMFRVIVDYNKSDIKTSTVPVEIIRKPLNVRNIRPENSEVEFIIRK
jgi:YbbR domain-containing protein